MQVKQLQWDESDNLDTHVCYTLLSPSWEDIEQALVRLDGQTYPYLCLSLRLSEDGAPQYPQLTIIGGGGVYSVTLELADAQGNWTGERIQSIHPALYWVQRSYRAIGRGYHNFEINEAHLLDDFHQVLRLVRQFAETGRWDYQVPFALESANLPQEPIHNDSEWNS